MAPKFSALVLAAGLVALVAAQAVTATVYFEEKFDGAAGKEGQRAFPCSLVIAPRRGRPA